MNATNEQPDYLWLNFHEDASHGWLEVDRGLLVEVGLAPSDLTAFSYRRGGAFYLEEDVDAERFLNAARIAGVLVGLARRDHGDRSWIRDLPSLHP